MGILLSQGADRRISTGIEEKEIIRLSNDMAKIEKDKIKLIVEYLESRVEGIVQDSVLYATS